MGRTPAPYDPGLSLCPQNAHTPRQQVFPTPGRISLPYLILWLSAPSATSEISPSGTSTMSALSRYFRAR